MMLKTSTSRTSYAGEPLPEVKVFTNRLLKAETTEKVLNGLYEIPNVRQINIHGEGLPVTVKTGPNTGIPVNHPERKAIKFGESEVELTMMVGSFFLELESHDAVEETVEQIREVCDELIPFGYDLEIGRYTKYRPTLTDYLKGLRC